MALPVIVFGMIAICGSATVFIDPEIIGYMKVILSLLLVIGSVSHLLGIYSSAGTKLKPIAKVVGYASFIIFIIALTCIKLA